MPEFLALEWEHDLISGVQAQVSSGRVRVRRCFTLPRPNMAAAGSGAVPPIDWLKDELVRQGVGGHDVLVALPRDEAVVKRLELPETTDDELPLIVRYQAAAKSSVPIDELSLDFIPLPRRSEVPGREVLMATVPQQTMTEVRTQCEAAGLRPVVLGLTPAAMAELVARAETGSGDDAGAASLLVARHGYRLEISVLRRGHLLFSHSARLSAEAGAAPEPQAIVAEVSRALVALRGAISDVKIDRAWTLFSEREHDEVSDVLKRRLGCEVRPLDPFAGVDCDRGAFDERGDKTLYAGPIGLLLSQAEPRVQAIDFLSPRKPPVKRDLRKRRLVIAGAAAGVLAAALLGLYWLKLSSLDGEIAELNQKKKGLEELLKKGEPTTKAAAAVDRWESAGIPWLDEIENLTKLLPGNDRIFLSSIQFEPERVAEFTATGASGRRPAVEPGRVLAKIKISGYAREPQDVWQLSERLHNGDPRYRVLPPYSGPAKDAEHYAISFNTDVLLIEPAPPPKGPGAASTPTRGGDRPAPTDEASKTAAAKSAGGPRS
ncbi:MAG: type IV pilus biogenesis protein PilM [Planctomycetaceae bacterium]